MNKLVLERQGGVREEHMSAERATEDGVHPSRYVFVLSTVFLALTIHIGRGGGRGGPIRGGRGRGRGL